MPSPEQHSFNSFPIKTRVFKVEDFQGPPGDAPEISVVDSTIVWKLPEHTEWTSLVPLVDLKGDPGETVDLSVEDSVLRFKHTSDTDWTPLVDIQTLIPETSSSAQVLFFDSREDFPEEGQVKTLYISEQENASFRWAEDSSFDFVIGPDMGDDYPDLATALNSMPVQDGHRLFIKNGTYTHTEAFTIDKMVFIKGESKEGVIITNGDPSTLANLVNIRADNVQIADLTIRHNSTNANAVTITCQGGGWPQTRAKNTVLKNVHVQYSKMGISLWGEDFTLNQVHWDHINGTSTRRAIGLYAAVGSCYIKSNHFSNVNGPSGALRAIAPISTTGTNENEIFNGTLVIDGCTCTGMVSQFVSHENMTGPAGGYTLVVMNNEITEDNAFVVLMVYNENTLDLLDKVIVINNKARNIHHATGGKGLVGIAGLGGPFPARSSALPVFHSGNELDEYGFRDGWEETPDSVGSIVGHSSVTSASVTLGTMTEFEYIPGDVPGGFTYIQLNT